MYYIIKRDNTKQPFDPQKIKDAVLKAFIAVDGESTAYAEEKAQNIADYIEGYMDGIPNELTIDDIQSLVENGLMSCRRKDVARAYIEYRHDRDTARKWNDKMMSVMGEKLQASNVQNQNANVDERSFGGRKGEADSVIMKQYALDNCMSEKSRKRHLNNEIYIHDLDSYAIGMHNCLSVPFDDLLAKGFNTRQTDVRPANSINTAFQLVAVIFQLQSLQQFGGVSATHLDWTMVPYVRKSFSKHIKDGHKYIKGSIIHCIPGNKPDAGLEYPIENWKYWVNEDVYQYAMDMTQRELQQAVEGLYHNLNTLQSRSGNQLPFTSINYGTCTLLEGRMVIKALLDGSIKGVGKFHKTPIFPCGIFQLGKGINLEPGDPNYDLYQLALESTAKRLYPNYANCDVKMQKDWINYDRKQKEEYINSLTEEQYNILITRLEENPELQNILMLEIYEGKIRIKQAQTPVELFSTMGCRTQNGADINALNSYQMNIQSVIETGHLYDNYISAAQKDGRGNICPVTIILPTIAMEAKEEVEKENKYTPFAIVDETNCNDISLYSYVIKFMELLNEAIHDAKDMLIERFEYICSQDPSSAKFMYENNTMEGYIPEEGIRSALKHGTLAIGQLGLAECLQILVGCDHTESKGMELAKKIEQLFKDRCAEFKQEYSLNFGVYYTPAENLCYTAMKKFKQKYGEIPNISDREYFTNSMHVPVWKEMSPIEKIDIESQLTGYSSAGCITYVELEGAVIQNLKALETLVNYAMDHDIPYFALNVPNDMCMECGYTGLINETCPSCGGSDIQRLRRVTGYLTGDYKTAFNQGKIAEVEDRYKHSKKMRGYM